MFWSLPELGVDQKAIRVVAPAVAVTGEAVAELVGGAGPASRDKQRIRKRDGGLRVAPGAVGLEVHVVKHQVDSTRSFIDERQGPGAFVW